MGGNGSNGTQTDCSRRVERAGAADGRPAVEFSVSGHVNRAVIAVDSHPGYDDNDLNHVDSNASEAGFRFTGSEDIGGMTAGVLLELGRPGDWRTRHAAVNLSGAFGKVTLGQTSAATDGMAHAKLGGPSWLGGVSNSCAYVSTGPACPSNDGDRPDVLRYDTPSLGPASIAVSAGNDEYWDAKLTVAGSFGDAGYDVRIGHIGEYDASAEPASWDHDASGNHVLLSPAVPATQKGDITTASAAVGFGQGTSVAVAWSQEKTGDETEYTYVELDHSYGDGSVGVYWKQGENSSADGSLWGVGVGYNLGAGATAYAGYRMMKEDDMEDVGLIIAGMRVTFN